MSEYMKFMLFKMSIIIFSIFLKRVRFIMKNIDLTGGPKIMKGFGRHSPFLMKQNNEFTHACVIIIIFSDIYQQFDSPLTHMLQLSFALRSNHLWTKGFPYRSTSTCPRATLHLVRIFRMRTTFSGTKMNRASLIWHSQLQHAFVGTLFGYKKIRPSCMPRLRIRKLNGFFFNDCFMIEENCHT